MGKWRLFLISWVAAIAAMPLVAAAVPFTNGNVVVVRSGDDTYASAGGAAVPAYLDEYTLDGTLVQSIPMGDYGDAVNPQFTLNGGDHNGGFISRSYDGQYLVLAGYNAPLGTPSVASTAPTSTMYQRTIARVTLSDGTIDTSTKLADSGYSSDIKSAASLDGNQFWAVGGNSSTKVRYASSLGATTAAKVVSNSNSYFAINIFKDTVGDPQLYVSRGSSSNAVNRIYSGANKLPTSTSSTSVSGVFSALASTSTYDYLLMDSNTLYLTDDDNNDGSAGVQKWTFDGTTWTYQYTLTAGLSYPNLRGLSGCDVDINGTTYPVLVATDGNGQFMYRIVDWGAGASWAVVAQAPANTSFQDVVVPYALLTPEPTSLLLLGLAGLFCLRRRRRA
jgi:hypothetical protein